MNMDWLGHLKEYFWVIDEGSTTPRRAMNLGDYQAHPRTIENSRVGFDKIGETEVYTTFLGQNLRFGGDAAGEPLLFETMVFGGPLDDDCTRYTTWVEALAGHALTCAEVRKAQEILNG